MPTQVAPICELLLTVGTKSLLLPLAIVHLSNMPTQALICELLPTVRTRLFLFLVDKFDVVVQARSFNLHLTMWALRPLLVVHLSDVPTQVAFCCDLLPTDRTNILGPPMLLSHMPREVFDTDVLLPDLRMVCQDVFIQAGNLKNKMFYN